MNQHTIQTLFAYNYWANHKVLDAAARVTVEQLHLPAGLSHASLFGALVHILAAEMVWRLRCQEGISPNAIPDTASFASLAELQQAWQVEEATMLGFVTALDDDQLQQPVVYTNSKGAAFQTPLWQILAHVVNHGTQFRAEAAVALSRFDCSPGDLDMILYFRQ